MKKQIITAFCAASLGAFAETTTNSVTEPPRIVVTATRTPVDIREIGSSIEVTTAAQMEQYQQRTALDAISAKPGINYSRNGGAGQQPVSIFTRGTLSYHTKILIDGIPVNDPSSPSRAADLGHLSTDQIERIEVLKGPQSVLYGSDAIGGVVNIITKRGEGKPSHFFDIEGGSYDSRRTTAGSSGGNELINYSASVSHYETDGISAAASGDEEDGYRNTTVQARVGITPTDSSGVDFIFRHVNTEGDLDGYPPPFYMLSDTPDRFDTDSTFFRTEGYTSLLDDLWQQRLGVSVAQHDRDSSIGADFEGETLRVDWQNDLYLHELSTLTFGADWEKESYKSSGGADANNETAAIFAQDQIAIGNALFLTAGLRHSTHQQFGDATTYRLTGAYLIEQTGTKLKANWGTGFRAPSLDELFNPAYGNPALEPEKSEGWELGIEQQAWDGRITAGITFFRNEIRDSFQYTVTNWMTYAGAYEQSSGFDTKGVEAFISADIQTNLNIALNYTYTDVDDQDAGPAAGLRVPLNQANLRVSCRPVSKLNTYWETGYIGSRTDFGGVSLSEYWLMEIGAGYQVSSNLLIYGRIENLTDAKYELADGYETAGISAYAGAKFTF